MSNPSVGKAESWQGLYPFLQDAPTMPDTSTLQAALLESVRQKSEDSASCMRRFFEGAASELIATARGLADMFARGGRLFCMGNGGSSCDASHIAVEFLHPVTTGRPALPAVNLCADTAMMSAVGNDVGFVHVFVRQLVAQARPGDALIGFSTSGNSENLMAAFAKGRELGLLTIGMTGYDGGRMAREGALDHCLVVASDSIHRIQETHVASYHILWDLVHTLLSAQPQRRSA